MYLNETSEHYALSTLYHNSALALFVGIGDPYKEKSITMTCDIFSKSLK